jgi:hypothetical protein
MRTFTALASLVPALFPASEKIPAALGRRHGVDAAARARQAEEVTEEQPHRRYGCSTRRGVRAVGWDAFAAMCARMAETLEPRRPDAIVGIARGGLIPAATLARMLRIDLYPVRLTRRARDVIADAIRRQGPARGG